MTKILSSHFFAAVFSCLLFVTSLATPASALEVPADWKFKKITTPHFDVVFDARQQELGEHYARQAEKAYSLLSPVFSAKPERTLVVINDKTDSTNGYATRIPYPHIMIYPVLPGPYESLSESGDWSLELIAHEYTHILTFEPATGIMKTLRHVFGSILAPNLLLPTWWKEGLAVQVESSLGTEGGRLKSIYQDATLRAMVGNHTLRNHTIDKANEYIPSWPEGMRPYLFGSLFWNQAVSEVGNEGMDRLNIEHSGHVPYLLNTPAQNVLKSSYEEIYAKALLETEQRALKQFAVLQTVPFTEAISVPVLAKYSSAPAISRDGKYLSLITVDYKADRVLEIFVRDPETKLMTKSLKVEIKSEEEPLAPVSNQDAPPSGSIQKTAWFHNSPKLVFDQLHYVNRIERYSDISMYDLTTQKTKRLTKGLRAREPAVSPDDMKIAFVKLDGGQTRLGLFDIASESSEILYTPKMGERISSPVFTDAGTIVFARRNNEGKEHLFSFSLTDKKTTSVLPAFPQARFPIMTKIGLMFTSSRNGVHNLYMASADLKNARPISHVPTMVSLSAFDPETEDIYATLMTPDGTRVQHIKKLAWQRTPADLPTISPMFADRFTKTLTPASVEPATATAEAADARTYPVSEYEAAPYLWPQYWIPFLWTSPEGGIVIQAVTSGFDPLKKHSYSAMVGWDTYSQSADWSFSYLNNVTSLPIQFVGAQTHSYLVTPDNKTEDSLASISALPEIWSFSDKTSLELGWRYLDRHIGRNAVKRTGPFGNLLYRNITQGGEQFTPQKGYGGYLTAVNYIEGSGLVSHSQFQAGGVFYFSKFLPKLHSIMLRASTLYTPERHLGPIYGTQSEAIDYLGQDLTSKFLIRGYSTGQFVGKTMYNANLEYRFPIKDFYQGSGTTPLFWRRLTGAVVADAIATDGIVYELTRGYVSVEPQKIFSSYGLEAKLETTVGYEFPITAVLGLYKGSDARYAPDPTLGLALQFSGF